MTLGDSQSYSSLDSEILSQIGHLTGFTSTVCFHKVVHINYAEDFFLCCGKGSYGQDFDCFYTLK